MEFLIWQDQLLIDRDDRRQQGQNSRPLGVGVGAACFDSLKMSV